MSDKPHRCDPRYWCWYCDGSGDVHDGTIRSKKDTKRWCRGKEGVEHTYVDEVQVFYFLRVTIPRCRNCGRKNWGGYRSEKVGT